VGPPSIPLSAAEGLAADGASHRAPANGCSASSSIYNLCVPLVLDMDVAKPSSTLDLPRNPGGGCWSTTCARVFHRVVAQARSLQLLSDEHFTVDGTLVEAWASLKSFQPRHPGPDSAAPTTPATRRVKLPRERRKQRRLTIDYRPEASWRRREAGKERNVLS